MTAASFIPPSPKAVEATSLSHVTDLACNPPQYPYIQPQTGGLPLTLYIVRVPGSRDVFLTPIKPKEKVISAQDVQSSLYFVHVNRHEDGDMAQAERRSSNSSTSTSELSQPPLYSTNGMSASFQTPAAPPITPPYSVLDYTPSFPAQPPSPPRQHRVPRKPLMQGSRQLSPQQLSIPADFERRKPIIPRRPLPTPPMEAETQVSLHADNERLLRNAEHTDVTNNPYLRVYDSLPSGAPLYQQSTRETSTSTLDPGSLTLIRRDPTSGQQWNVAVIRDPPVQEVSSAALLNPPTAGRRVKKGGAPLYLDITNLGYLQFNGNSQSGAETRTSISSNESSADAETAFQRRLYMPGGRHNSHSYGRRKSASSSSYDTDEYMMRRSLRQRSSVDYSSSAPRQDRRSKGYTFVSPWNGLCEFATGTSGRSLKCQHSLPGRDAPEDVSELRFNLPTASRYAPTTLTSTPLSLKRTSYFSQGRKASHDSSCDGGSSPTTLHAPATPNTLINEDGSLNLNLGREKAGGGFGGKQAKLGKLIVEPEGLKMLDLLVAANLGLWWRAWDRL